MPTSTCRTNTVAKCLKITPRGTIAFQIVSCVIIALKFIRYHNACAIMGFLRIFSSQLCLMRNRVYGASWYGKFCTIVIAMSYAFCLFNMLS